MTLNQKHTSSSPSTNTPYVGRFAPSPSGPLHFGSLVCALASFLHAKQNNGQWLVRIEDIDTPRVDASMNSVILRSLEQHGLEWDSDIMYQSECHDRYQAKLEELHAKGLLYACACSRKQIKQRSGYYDGHCRQLNISVEHHALRFKQDHDNGSFTDLLWGKQNITHPIANEDPVLKRADGIFAYHLVVVLDDIEQNVTHIVRGLDLVETTPIHLSLYDAFAHDRPNYAHIPVIAQKPNQKLSKQHHSPAISDDCAAQNLKLALRYLGISALALPKTMNVEEILAWAIKNWSLDKINKQPEMLVSCANGVYSLPTNNNEVTE